MFWISDEKLLIFASLISPSKMILFEKKYQTFDTVFHHQMKHLEVRQKYSATRRIFNCLLGVSSGDETLRLMFDILLRSKKSHDLSIFYGLYSIVLHTGVLHSRFKVIQLCRFVRFYYLTKAEGKTISAATHKT